MSEPQALEPATIEELQEFIDGRLDGERLQEVHAYLARNPETARLVQRMRRTDTELRRLGARMLAGKRGGRPRNARAAPATWRVLTTAVSAGLLIAVGAASGWWAGMSSEDSPEEMADAFLGEIVNTYDYTASGNLQHLDFSADQRDGWAQWASQAYGQSIEPPDLREYGYEYIGARMTPSASTNGSLLAYRADDDTTISVYCWKKGEGPGELPRQATKNGYRINTISGAGYGLAVIGPDDAESLNQATRSISSAFRKFFEAT